MENKARLFRVLNYTGKFGIGKEIGMVGNPPSLIRLEFGDKSVYDFHPSKLEEIQTEDCTPTWAVLLPLYLEYLMNDSAIINTHARKELNKMADIADRYNTLSKEHEECLASYKRSTYNALESMSMLIDCIEHPEKVNDNIRLRIDGVKLLIAEYRDAKAAEDSAASH
jgi:hypothetical protein